MSSSDSSNPNHQNYNNPMEHDGDSHKRKKDYICPCGKPYGSYPAIYAHIKRKHDGKAPGQIIKPKPIRRRGRPFKYEPTKLQSQNPHRSASKHLESYLMARPYDCDLNQYPLKQFADKNSKSPLANFKYGEDQYSKPKYGFENGHHSDQRQRSKMDAPVYRFGPRDPRNPLPADQAFPQNWDPYHPNQVQEIQNQQRIRMDPRQEKGENYRFGTNENLAMTPGYLRDYKRLPNQKPILQNPSLFPNDSLLNRFQFLQQQNMGDSYGRGYDPSIESMYLKPFEIELRQEMESKFKPISQGIIHFLEPILQQLLNDSSLSKPQKPIQIEDSLEQKLQKPQLDPQEQKLPQEKHGQFDGQGGQQNKAIQQNLHKNQTQKQSQQITVSTLLQNQHFRDILKWLMSPPEEIPSQRIKENYIEFSFRCCLVEFLDFLHNFLETVQHEQVLLTLVFFCDHILAETGSFQLQPQPQIYEMGLYLNSFINEYLPKLSKFMPCLERFYMFKELKKKVSELFMWLSSWQAIQQYYHNRYHRQRIIYEISQENYKCMMYQRKYQSYMREAMRGCNGEPQQLISVRPEPENELNQIHQNGQAEEKTQENPEIIILNTEQQLGGALEEGERFHDFQQGSQSISKHALQSQSNEQNPMNSQQSVHDQIQIINSNLVSNQYSVEKQADYHGAENNLGPNSNYVQDIQKQ